MPTNPEAKLMSSVVEGFTNDLLGSTGEGSLILF